MEKTETSEYISHGEALKFLGINVHTFRKYAERLGIEGRYVGRKKLFARKDIDAMDSLLAGLVPSLIMLLEEKTGKKVKLV